jgi:hypothetical protein
MKTLHYIFSPSAWSWPHALILACIALYLIFRFAARIESWHQRRVRQRYEALIHIGRRVSIDLKSHNAKRSRRRHG